MLRLNKKGFTLPEVIVTIVITSMVMLILVSFTATIGKIYSKSAAKNDQQFIISNVKQYLKNELSLAQEIQTTADPSYNKLEFVSDMLMKNGTSVLSQTMYQNQKITASMTAFGSVLTVSLRIEDPAGKAETYEFSIKTYNKINLDIKSPTSVLYYK